MWHKIIRHWVMLIPPVCRILIEKELKRTLRKTINKSIVLEIGAKNHSREKLFPNATYSTLDIEDRKDVTYCQDIHKTNLPSSHFDLVIAVEVLEHLYDPALAVKEISRILQKGGTFIGSTRFLYPYHGKPEDYFRFTEYGLRKIFKGYEIVQIIPNGSWLINLWDSLTFSAIFSPLKIFNFLMIYFNRKKTDFPSGFVIVAIK